MPAQFLLAFRITDSRIHVIIFSNEAGVWFGVPGSLSVCFNHSDWAFCNFSIAAPNTKSSTVASLFDLFHSFYRVITLGLKLKRIESFQLLGNPFPHKQSLPNDQAPGFRLPAMCFFLLLDFY
jgi:hypothetical protein